MLFNSIEFLIFFPLITFLYFALPHKFRWFLLLAASVYFYMSFIPVYITILVLTIIVDYYAGIMIEKTEGRKRKAYLVFSIIVTCLILFIFKYINFFNNNILALSDRFDWHYPFRHFNILLPVGLSFHTFQSMAYVIEVYRGNQKAERNFGIYSLYVMFYPQLVAGPIERPQNLLHQFYEKHEFDAQRVSAGLRMMMWGYLKKCVMADRLSIFVDAVYKDPRYFHGFPVVLALIFYAFQIYCDFSGYSDIALGSAKVMGFKLMTNFDHPFKAKSVTEFWRRWHISLYTWFNDYVFNPLVIAWRNMGKWGIALSLFVTFAISGLWHGANWTFVIFGSLHGLALIYEFLTKKTRRKWSETVPAPIYNTLSTILVFAFAAFAWIFFRSPSFAVAGQIMRNVGFGNVKKIFEAMHTPDLIISICGIILLEIINLTYRKTDIELYLRNRPVWLRYGLYYMGILIISQAGVFSNQQFIYFQF